MYLISLAPLHNKLLSYTQPSLTHASICLSQHRSAITLTLSSTPCSFFSLVCLFHVIFLLPRPLCLLSLVYLASLFFPSLFSLTVSCLSSYLLTFLHIIFPLCVSSVSSTFSFSQLRLFVIFGKTFILKCASSSCSHFCILIEMNILVYFDF